MASARVVAIGPGGDVVRREVVRIEPAEEPSPRIVTLAASDPARFARRFADALAAGECPLVLNPALPPRARAALEARVVLGSRAPHAGHLLCTSGTTGEGGVPQAFFFRREAALANAHAHLTSIGVSDGAGERLLLPTPIWHSFGVVAGLFATAVAGGELFGFEATPDPASIARVLAEHEISTLYLNPTLARLLSRSLRRRPLPPLPALRRVSIGSASIARGELLTLMRQIPNASFYVTYGLTEMGPRVSTFAAGSAASPHPLLLEEPSRSAPIGRPIDGVSCSIADGRLAVVSPYAAHAQWLDGSPRALPSGSAGYVTADAAASLASGDLEVLGRVDDTIVTGGLNVHAEDVERAALAVDGVAAACAVGAPSEIYGEIVFLLCEPEPGSSESALEAPLTAALTAALPPTHMPKTIRFVPALPRTTAGKVLRREAKSLATARAPERER